MKVEGLLPGEALVRMKTNELLLLANALNEVRNGIDIAEFHTRLGVNRDEASRFHRQIKKVLAFLRALDSVDTAKEPINS